MPEIPSDISGCVAAIRIDARRVSKLEAEMRELVGHREDVADQLTQIRVLLCGVMAECNQIDALMGAARVTGQSPCPPRKRQAEPDDRQLVLAGLHRAGDHTLDDDGEDSHA